MIQILLAEDQAMVRGALVTLLNLEPDFVVAAEVARGDQILAIALEVRPDVALLDIEMPGGDGLTGAAALHRALPDCCILILTTFGRPGYLRRAMESGARGFLVKDAPAAQLAVAIRRALAGEAVVDPTLAASALAAGLNPLIERECDVLRLSRRGESIVAIAQALALSEGTVRNYLSSALQKLGAHNRTEAAIMAEEQGWLL